MGTTDGIVVGGKSIGPNGARAGARGATDVTIDGAGMSVRLGVTAGTDGKAPASAGAPDCCVTAPFVGSVALGSAPKKAFAICAMICASGAAAS